MTVAETLTVEDLATSLLDVLERVRCGEQFTIERDGEVIATLGPPLVPRGITWGEFLATYHELPRPDDRFADDLEAIQAEQGLMPEPPEWPD
jgi:antitoxin (DNA-binding transcriptional repressor) of toxin-antitoxin stability system